MRYIKQKADWEYKGTIDGIAVADSMNSRFVKSDLNYSVDFQFKHVSIREINI